MVQLRSCRFIYYFDTPALGIRHQLFDRVNMQKKKKLNETIQNVIMIMQYIERKREILVEKLNNAFGGVYINFK